MAGAGVCRQRVGGGRGHARGPAGLWGASRASEGPEGVPCAQQTRRTWLSPAPSNSLLNTDKAGQGGQWENPAAVICAPVALQRACTGALQAAAPAPAVLAREHSPHCVEQTARSISPGARFCRKVARWCRLAHQPAQKTMQSSRAAPRRSRCGCGPATVLQLLHARRCVSCTADRPPAARRRAPPRATNRKRSCGGLPLGGLLRAAAGASAPSVRGACPQRPHVLAHAQNRVISLCWGRRGMDTDPDS